MDISFQMTIEPPRGLKNNLKQNFGPGGLVNRKTFEYAEFGDTFKRLLFGLGLIHAIIHERKKFGSLGWNLTYEFNNSDLEVSILQLQSTLSSSSKSTQLPFNEIEYVVGQIIYGGRVTDDFDRSCLLSILSTFFCNDAIQEDYYYAQNKVSFF